MKYMSKDSDLEKLMNEARSKGLRVRRPGLYRRYCTYIHETILIKFTDAARLLDYKIQEAATDALELWLDSKKDELNAAAAARKKK